MMYSSGEFVCVAVPQLPHSSCLIAGNMFFLRKYVSATEQIFLKFTHIVAFEMAMNCFLFFILPGYIFNLIFLQKEINKFYLKKIQLNSHFIITLSF